MQTTEYETSFIENPHASETSPMILPVNNLNSRANGTLGIAGREKYRATKIRMRDTENHVPSDQMNLPSPEDPWIPQKPIFRRDDDDDFKEKVKFAHIYVLRLSSFMQKMEKERVTSDKWKVLAKIVNRFFMVITVTGFIATALLFYLFTSPRE